MEVSRDKATWRKRFQETGFISGVVFYQGGPSSGVLPYWIFWVHYLRITHIRVVRHQRFYRTEYSEHIISESHITFQVVCKRHCKILAYWPSCGSCDMLPIVKHHAAVHWIAWHLKRANSIFWHLTPKLANQKWVIKGHNSNYSFWKWSSWSLWSQSKFWYNRTPIKDLPDERWETTPPYMYA